MLLADVEEGHKGRTDFADLLLIFLISKFEFLESACGIYEITGIYAHFLTGLRSFEGGIRIEMHIGHQGHMATGLVESGTYLRHIGCLTHTLCGETHEFSTCFRYTKSLGYTCFCIECGGIVHRLHPYRVITPDQYASGIGDRAVTTFIIIEHNDLSDHG